MVSKFRYVPILIMIVLGAILGGIAFNAFLIPHKLLSGGVSGIALILNYIFGLNPGVLIFIINIPIFLAGYKYVDREFILLSLVGMTVFAVSIDMFSFLKNVVYIDDTLLSCLYGGVLNGIGMGIVFRNRASQGGVDIIAVILKKYLSINLGRTSLIINFVVLAIASFFFGLEPAMYTLVSMYVASTVLDKVQQGFGSSKSVIIITDCEQQVADEILKTLDRGVTYLEGEGAYTGNKKKVIYCIVALKQLAKLKQIVNDIDSSAFMAVSDTAEVLGHGFRNRGI
ncbi:MAG: YitT family protein [Gracilibacteraceae bacterium]|nr:YitT family protein [Gracilibacteraceae bacterium]